jgi:hypothetical protein
MKSIFTSYVISNLMIMLHRRVEEASQYLERFYHIWYICATERRPDEGIGPYEDGGRRDAEDSVPYKDIQEITKIPAMTKNQRSLAAPF